MSKLITSLIAVACLLSGASAATAQSRDCMPIGGVAIPHFFAEGEGKPVVI